MPIAKLRPWRIIVAGVVRTIAVLSTDSPDQIGSVGVGYQLEYDNDRAYPAGAVVRVSRNKPIGGLITPATGVYGALIDVPAKGTGNQIPQFPAPTSGLQYWYLIAFSPKLSTVCANGKKQVYVNASSDF